MKKYFVKVTETKNGNKDSRVCVYGKKRFCVSDSLVEDSMNLSKCTILTHGLSNKYVAERCAKFWDSVSAACNGACLYRAEIMCLEV